MMTTGYALREALGLHTLRRDTAARSFGPSLKAFDGDKKDPPSQVMEQFLVAERAIAKLQVAQARYNLIVTVKVLGEEMTLSEAIKLVGGLGRAEKMWKSATGPKTDRYGGVRDEDERDPSRVFSKPTVSVSEAVRLATAAGKRSGAVRAAIATANAREVDIENLDAALFE